MVKKDEIKTQEKSSSSQLSIQRYVGLSMVIILLLVLMFVIINLETFLRARQDALNSNKYFDLEQNSSQNVLKREGLDSLEFTLVSDKSSLVEDGLKKSKISYSLLSSLKDIKQSKDNLILDGDMIKDEEDLKILNRFIEEKKIILFLTMPDKKYIEQLNLEEILGIGKITGVKNEKTLTLVPGFILGGLHELKGMSYETYDVDLIYSTKIFAYGKKNAPIIWRNTHKDSQIYVVNGPFMDTNASYGLLSGLMSEMHEDYIYPVVNARLMTYEGLPYITDENKDKLEKFYNRDAMKFQNDILLPNILTINTRREFVANGYLRVGFDKDSTNSINDNNIKLVKSVWDQIYKDGGEIGVRFSGDFEYDKNTYNKVFKGEKIKSILLDKSVDDIKTITKRSKSLESVVGPWEGNIGFEYLDKDTVYIPFTVDGLDTKGQKELEFLSGLTAFGSIVHNLDMEEFVLLDGDKENWTQLSKDYIKFIDSYRQRFNFLENKNISETFNSVKIFRNSSPKINIAKDKIQLTFEGWYEESYFILRTDKVIGDVVNGEVKEIEAGTYLVTALGKNVEINVSKAKNTNVSR